MIAAVQMPAIGASDRVRLALVWSALTSLTALTALALAPAVAPEGNFGVAVAIVSFALVCLAIWRQPVLGVYLTFAVAVLIEERALGFSDSVTDTMPLFESLSATFEMPGAIITPVELLLMVTAACWLLRSLDERGRLSLKADGLQKPLLLFVAFVLLGALHGVQSGANFTQALWLVRPLLLLAAAFFLASQLITDRRHLGVLCWLLVLGAGLKGIIGWYRFEATLGGETEQLSGFTSIASSNSVLAHEESFFFAAFYLALAIALLVGVSGRLRLAGFALALPITMAFLANDRRAAVVALVLTFAGLLLLGRALFPGCRRLLTTVGLLAVVVLPVYLGAFWSNDGLVGQPAQAIRSGFEPDERDFSSNEYRRAEAVNLEQTFRQNVLFGVGFGVPMTEVEELPDISELNPWYLLVPHNTVLWLLAALGIVGFLAFWNFIAAVIVGGLHIARRLASAELRGFALFAVLATAAFLVIGYLDQGLFSARMGLFVGIVLGALVRLPDIEHAESST